VLSNFRSSSQDHKLDEGDNVDEEDGDVKVYSISVIFYFYDTFLSCLLLVHQFSV